MVNKTTVYTIILTIPVKTNVFLFVKINVIGSTAPLSLLAEVVHSSTVSFGGEDSCERTHGNKVLLTC